MASIVAFRYTEKYKPLLGGKEIPVSQMIPIYIKDIQRLLFAV